MKDQFVIGLDYGSDSVRCVVVNAKNGAETGSAVCYYPRWKAGKYCDPARNRYRQHPLDYIESLERVVREALAACGPGVAERVCGISFDTTCSTPVLTDRAGTPLALLPRHAENPNAMFVLWKDHTAIAESDTINDLAKRWTVDYTRYSGNTYSCEWVWSKVLHCLREDPSLREDAWAWIEHCDWMPALLTGNTEPGRVVRSRCAAGHKAMWHASWGGLPSGEFLEALDPLLAGFRERLYTETCTGDTRVGGLTSEWAARLGLPEGIAVGTGIIDCHAGAIGAGIREGTLVKVMGTSTCDILIGKSRPGTEKIVTGICGQVDGSVIPGYIGYEAGQSAFGDIYAWFRELMSWPLRHVAHADPALEERILDELTRQAECIGPGDSGLVASDWFNGRRTPDPDLRVTGTLCGLTLSTSAPAIFRALVEATAFGSRAINERMTDEGVEIAGIIALGGIARKSPFVMQVMADVIGLPIRVARTSQTCAAGAAMFAAVAAGLYPSVEEAQRAMGAGFDAEYVPDPARHARYDRVYERYRALGAFIDGF